MEMREGVVHLADGRRIGFAVCGRQDAGSRLVYNHGSPGCRLEILALQKAIDLRTADLCVVAFDRPGFGLSDPLPGRTFFDWPRDVAEAADKLGIGSMAILGASGGSPYAMACAIALADRVTRLGLVVGTGPAHAPAMDESALFRLPPRNSVVRRLQFGMLAMAFRRGKGEKVVAKSTLTLAEVDQQAMARPEVRAWFGDVFAESLRQGGRAAADETAMYWADWGFAPRDIAVETLLWYSGLDTNVPAAVGRWLHEEIADSRLEVWPHHGHFTWAFSKDLTELVADLCAVAR